LEVIVKGESKIKLNMVLWLLPVGVQDLFYWFNLSLMGLGFKGDYTI
jgi:hypothetical protein